MFIAVILRNIILSAVNHFSIYKCNVFNLVSYKLAGSKNLNFSWYNCMFDGKKILLYAPSVHEKPAELEFSPLKIIQLRVWNVISYIFTSLKYIFYPDSIRAFSKKTDVRYLRIYWHLHEYSQVQRKIYLKKPNCKQDIFFYFCKFNT